MKDDDFFSSVEEEVRVANAEKLNVFVRCAATKMGTTIPNGYEVFKQDVVSSVSMVPETDYGFWRWAAFSTDFFDPNKQHTTLLCQNPESYAESFAPFELDSTVVTFENPNSEITNVTIHANRNDIVLVPVCVERPMLTVSIPGSGEANVVRNMSIRLLFSKPMDPKSFYDEETGASNFTFLQGRATITESSDVSLTDISDYFESPIFSMGGKLITFKLKSDKLFNANGQITVRYTGEVKDIYGYNVASGSSFQFRVGTAVDSSSPGIDVLTFGVDGKYDTFTDIYSKFRSEANVASVKGVSDELCATSLDDPAFETIATYRTKSNIVDIYVHGIEYKGSSKLKLNASGDESESDIVIIGTRSCLVYNKDGTPTGSNIAEEKVAEIDYAAGVSYSKDIPESAFSLSTGTLFSYDISDYPDGLIRIDVALADSVGNFGFDDNCTNAENDNGYKSVFIVKDTSAPDAIAIKDAIESDSESAIYQWYNEKTLGTIRFKDMDKDNPVAGIVDSGHFRLRSAKKDMKWIFHSGAENDEWAPSENDAGWKDVSVSYDLKNAVLPGRDGYVPISVAFMDDLGHISPVVGITAITYDNTKPTVDSYMWVDSTNAETINNSKLDVLEQQLKVGFTETLSGVRRIALKITKDANVVDGLAHSVKVYYSASDEVPSGAELALVPVEDVTDSSYKFYEIPSALTSGYLFFRGIPIAAVDGKYDVSVSLIDQALNESPSSSPIAMFKDTTSPSVNQATVSVDNIVVRPGDDDDTQWLKRDAYNSNSVSFTVNETGSGIRSIGLGGTIEITAATTVSVNGAIAEDYSLDVASNRITFTNFKNPSIFGSSVSVKISGIKFTDRDSESGNTVSFRIVDFASTEPHDFEYGYKVYADSAAPVVASVTLHDADSTTEWTAGTTNYRYIYTNSDKVNATVVFADAEKGTNSCSGIRVLTITGATITGASVSTGKTCTVSGNTVTFTPPLRAGSETVELTGVTLVASDSEKRSISAYATDFAEWTGDAVSSQIIVLDTLPPKVTEISWTVASGSDLIPGITGKPVVDDQKLNVKLGATESGVKTLSVAVTIEGTRRNDSLENENLKVYFDGTLLSSTDYSVSENTLTFTTPRKSGEVSFEGLTIDDQDRKRDGSYLIDVSLKTAAENENTAASHYSISRDSVTPVISKVVIPPVTVDDNQIPVIESVIPYGTNGTGTTPVYFAGAQAGFDYKTGKNSFTLDLYIKEQTSGVQQITFEDGCNVRLSSESTLSVIHSSSTKDLVKGTDYTLDGTGKVITFLDSGVPVVKDESAEFFVLSMTNCTFENVKYIGYESASDENRFSFTLKDFAQHSPETSVTTIKAKEDGTENIATVVANALPAAIESVSLEDRSPCDANGNVESGKGDGPYDLRKSEEGFTNYEIINVTVSSPTVDVANKNYSVRKITLSGAKFITAGYDGKENNNTGVSVVINSTNSYPLGPSDYKITDDNSSIEFNKSFDTQTAFQFFNVLLGTTDDDEKTVYATAYSPAGVSYSAMSTKDKIIILDKTPPVLADDGPFAYDRQDFENFRKYEYPRQENDTDYDTYGLKASDLGLANYGSMAGNTGKEIRFFYTSQDYRRLPVKVEDTNSISSINENYLQIKVVNSINAGEATSQGVLNAYGYAYSTNPAANFSAYRLGYTTEDVGYYKYKSEYWSDNPMPKPYTYVAADRAGNVSEPHQFYVIKDDKGPSKTYDGSVYTEGTKNTKSLTNLMTLKCPSGKRVFRNTQKMNTKMTYKTSGDDFFFGCNPHDATESWGNVWTYKYVVSGSRDDESYKIIVRLDETKDDDILLDGNKAKAGIGYREVKPDPSQSGLAKWCVSTYYSAFNSDGGESGSDTEIGWCALYPNGTLGATSKQQTEYTSVQSLLPEWKDYVPGEDIEIEIPKNKTHIAPMTLCLMDNCGNVNQIMIRPNELETGEINSDHSSDDKYKLMGGEAISFVYDNKLPGVVEWTQGVENTLDDQFIIFAGGCDDNQYKNISGDTEHPNGNTYSAVGHDRLGALYRDTVNNIQYYNHKVYLQLLVKSNEPILWDAQEERTNNVQPLYENGSQPSDFTLRARVLFREGTDANKPKEEESPFAGPSSDSLTKWSYFKQKSTDGKRLWNILMPHGDEGKLGTLWLYLEDYVGNKGIYRITNGKEDKFVWNNEPPKVKLRTVADYPASYDTEKTATNASKFSSFGTYRHYNHLAFTSEADIKRLVPPTIFKKKYITTQTSNMSDSRYSAMINKAEADGLVMNDINVIGDVTYVGDTAYNVSGGDYAREEVGNNTYAVNPVLCFFDIDVSDSPSGIDGYRYCFADNEGDDNRQNDWEGNKSNGYWYINHTGRKNDSKRVNAQVPVNLSYNEGADTEYNQRTFNLYIRDRVGNVSVTKLGNKWMMDNTYPATVNGSTWTGGKANPGNSYLSLPGADSRKQINVTIAGSSETFKTAKGREESYSVKIPADWFTDFQKRINDGSGTDTSSGVYGAGLIPNVKGSAKPIADGYLTVDIPYFIYKDANATTAKTLEYYIFDNTGNYWTCNLNVKVDASAPTMRVGVTRLNDSSTFHSVDNLYTKVYGTGAVPTGKTPDTTATAGDRLVYQGNALKTFTPGEGYSTNIYENLYSLASNVSKQYESKSDVDNAYQYGTPDEKSRFFKIRSNNAAFFVNAWAEDSGGISQVSIRKWDKTSGVWSTNTAMGDKALEFNNGDSSVTSMSFETNPPSPYILSGKPAGSNESDRYAIYVTTESQTEENLYEVSATDFAGNAVFYYAYILPYDNKAPEVTAASVTGNAGSSVVGGKFYFKDLKFSLKASDDRAGLGAYQYGTQGTLGFIKYDGDISGMETSSLNFADNPNFWVKVQDILGNVKTVESFTVNGGDTPISNANFVYDNVAPGVSFTDLSTNFIRTGSYWDYTSWGESSDDTGVSTNSFLNYEASSKSLLVTNRDYSSKIEITPTGTDTSGIKGYVMTETSAAPASLATVASSFVFEAGKELSTSFEERKISLANTSGLTVYFWAVDYAGNVSTTPAQLTIKFDAKNPDVSPAPADGKIEVKTDTTKGTRIWSSETHNYYKDAAYIEVTLGYKTGYEPKGWKILKSESSSNSRDNQLAWKNFVSSDYEQLDGNLRKYKIYLPALVDARNNGDDFYISFYSNSDSPTYRLVFADKQKWYYDKDGPSAPNIQGLAEGAVGMYYDEAGKLYFKSDASGTLNFTATDNGTVKSGFAGVKYSTTESAPVASVDVSSSVALTGSDLSGKTNLYFYAYDNVWNASSTSYKLTLEEDNIPPTFTVSVDDSSDYVYKKDAATIYYNGTAEHKPESIVFTCSSSDSDLAEFICTASGVTVTQGTGSDSNKFTVSGLGDSGSVVLSFKAKDKLGNVTSDADVTQITLVADGTSPSGLAIYKIKGIPLDDEAKYIYTESADWKTVSGGTVYCKADQLTDLVAPFEYADTLADAGSGLKEGSPSASKDPVTDNKWIVTASDNVGNETTYTVILIADGVAPVPSESGKAKSAINCNNGVSWSNVDCIKSSLSGTVVCDGLVSAWGELVGDTLIYVPETIVSFSIDETLSGISEYGFALSNLYPAASLSPAVWVAPESDGSVKMPELTGPNHSFLYVWIKDKVGNVSTAYPYSSGGTNAPWVNCYKTPENVEVEFARTYSERRITIKGLTAAFGIKEITFAGTGIESNGGSYTLKFTGDISSGSSSTSSEFTVSNVADADVTTDSVKLDLFSRKNSAVTCNGDVVITYYGDDAEATLSSMSFVDHQGNSHDVTISTPITRSLKLLQDKALAVVDKVTGIFGRIAGDKETRALKAAERADKKAARQAEIAAAKEAKKQAKLLAKQQKEEAKKLKESLAVQDADIGALESKSVSAGTETAALDDQDVEFEALSTGINQWNKASASVERGKSGKNSGSFPVIPFAAGAVVLCACGAGVYMYRRKKSK